MGRPGWSTPAHTTVRRRWLGAAVAAGACIAVLAITDVAPAQTTTEAKQAAAPAAAVQVLWTVTADRVSSAGSTLTLDGVAPTVTRFADRPARAAWTVGLDTFLDRWGKRFDADPPNATLSWVVPGEGKPRVAAVTLTDPHHTGDHLTFHAVALPVTDAQGVTLPPAASPQGDHVTVTIDTAPIDLPTPIVLPSGLGWQSTGGVILPRTSSPDGQPHTLVLHLAPAVPGLEKQVVTSKDLFAVVSGTSNYSIDGDAIASDWRFTVDPSRIGETAPIIVLKFAPGPLTDLVSKPNRFRAASELTDDPTATSARLQGIVAAITAEASSARPDASYYWPIAAILADSNWDGVVIFNATVAPPAQVKGHPTPVLPAPVLADVVAFPVAPLTPAGIANSSLLATINWPGRSTAPGGPYLKALFQNDVLAEYATGT